MSSEQEIVRIGRQLEKVANSDTPNDEVALDMLKSLQGLPMTLDVLQKSRVGMSVNKLRKKCGGTELATMAKKLIKSWKKLVPGSSKDVRHGVPHSPTKAHSPHHTPTLHRLPSNPPTPPPVTYSPPASSADSNYSTSSKFSSTPSQIPNGEVPSFETSSQSSEQSQSSQPIGSPLSPGVILFFPPSLDGGSRVPPTGSDVRDRCRDLIIKALKKGFTDVTIEEEIKFHNLGAAIEEAIFSEFRDTGNKYKMRLRSRVSNLGDLRNPDLRQRVISGDIPPARIAVMTTEEMASDSMKKLRQQFTKDAIRDAQMGISGGTHTSLLKCSKCKKRNCTYNQAQTRSADEPMTTFAYCNDCGHRWKFC